MYTASIYLPTHLLVSIQREGEEGGGGGGGQREREGEREGGRLNSVYICIRT